MADEDILSTAWIEFIKNNEMLSHVHFVRDEAEPVDAILAGLWSQWDEQHQLQVNVAKLISESNAFINPRLLNALLTGQRLDTRTALYRFGIGGHDQSAPTGRRMIEMFENDWCKRVSASLPDVAARDAELRAKWAFDAHLELLVISPFEHMTNRTARFVLNNLRIVLGLDVLVIKFSEAKEYWRLVDEFRAAFYAEKMVA